MKPPIRIPDPAEKTKLYAEAATRLTGLLQDEHDPIVLMASMATVLHHTMPHFYWTGFYRVCGDELVIGPYQGTPACLRIAKGKGVCGSAWEKREAIVVDDVHAFPGHIACDALSESEIVVPWKNTVGEVIAVLDVDSTLPAAFTLEDLTGLTGLLESMIC